ncbi:MAG: tryptophan synthase subunit alpha [Planctomycetota bacterium]
MRRARQRTMGGLKNNRLVETFERLRAAGKKTLVPFVTAGYPDLETSGLILKDIESRGVGVCELGIPFSDPIADGPVIQTSYTSALAAGVTSEDVFRMVGSYRAAGGGMALVAMVSYSIVFRHDVAKYLEGAKKSGFDGLIIPDLTLEEAGSVEQLASDRGLANIMLIAPTTPPERRLRIAGHSRGFIYFISVAGITGERDKLPEQSIAAVAELRKHTSTPICIGFGISNPATVAHVCEVADGAIVGSAIVHRITDAKDMPRDDLARHVGRFVGELISPLVG